MKVAQVTAVQIEEKQTEQSQEAAETTTALENRRHAEFMAAKERELPLLQARAAEAAIAALDLRADATAAILECNSAEGRLEDWIQTLAHE